MLREQQPDLVVLDLRMPAIDGLTLLRRIRAEGIDTPALILTMSDSEVDLSAALRAGVRGYLLKDMEPEDVIAAIGNAARGELTVAPAMTLKLAQLLQSGSKGSDRRGLLASLTERERQILEHLARGESNKTIARALDISHDTVKLHVRHILSKLNLSSRVEAAVFAVEARSGGGQLHAATGAPAALSGRRVRSRAGGPVARHLADQQQEILERPHVAHGLHLRALEVEAAEHHGLHGAVVAGAHLAPARGVGPHQVVGTAVELGRPGQRRRRRTAPCRPSARSASRCARCSGSPPDRSA